MYVFDDVKARGVEDIFFISMDGGSGLEEGLRAIRKIMYTTNVVEGGHYLN
ncbi:hypothetical protein HXZ66_11070 [Bacillus sp. A116_S68]|nr:hypothetical protein HXZ66_11070 [Bacillus sp. A116_S68]